MTTSGDAKLVFDTLKVGNFNLSFNNDHVALFGIQVGNVGRIDTPSHHIVIDNVNRRLYNDVTGQLVSRNKPFDLELFPGRYFQTTASLVQYDPRYIGNLFSTENSLLRLQFKRGTLPDALSARLAENATLIDNMVLADNLSDFLAPAAGPAVTSEDEDEWFKQIPSAKDASDIEIVQ